MKEQRKEKNEENMDLGRREVELNIDWVAKALKEELVMNCVVKLRTWRWNLLIAGTNVVGSVKGEGKSNTFREELTNCFKGFSQTERVVVLEDLNVNVGEALNPGTVRVWWDNGINVNDVMELVIENGSLMKNKYKGVSEVRGDQWFTEYTELEVYLATIC